MIKIKNGSIQSAPCHIGRIDAIAYDGCEFSLLTTNQKAIIRLDQCLCPIETIPTSRKYHCLCYSMQKHCYWAMCVQRPCTLFMLDENFCEIDTLKLPSSNASQPYAISCSPCCDTLMILYANAIVHVDICNRGYQCIPLEHKDRKVFDLLALAHGYVLAYYQDHQFFIEVNGSEFGCPSRFCIPDGYCIEGMYQRNCAQTSTDCGIYEIDIILSDVNYYEQYILPIQIQCENDEEEEEEKEDCECHGSTPSCQCGVYEILHSIALEEAGLAHILNAEGEKIQKAVASDVSIDELLRVNSSVSETIRRVTILEGQLIAKLENVLCFCGNEEECEPCSKEDSCE